MFSDFRQNLFFRIRSILTVTTVLGVSFSSSSVLAQNSNIPENQSLNILDVASQIIRMDYVELHHQPSAQKCKRESEFKAKQLRGNIRSLYYYHRDSNFLGIPNGSGHCYIWLVDNNASRSALLTNALLSSFANGSFGGLAGGLPGIQDAQRKINGLHFRHFGFHAFESSDVCLTKVNRWKQAEKAKWAVWSHQANNCFGIISDESFVPNRPEDNCTVNDSQLRKQANWKWDRKSHNLIYDAHGAISPAGGKPEFRGSYNYVLYYVPFGCKYTGVGQANWRWDRKSHNLIYDARGAISPAGGRPEFRGSYNYVLFNSKGGKVNGLLRKYQVKWRWDRKSHNLMYGVRDAITPAGGRPDYRGSYNYALEYK